MDIMKSSKVDKNKLNTVYCFCLLFVCATKLTSVLSQGTLPDRNPTYIYPFTTDLDAGGDYILRWGFNETHIWFEVQAHTLGYVGFGVSESGKMVPADVVVGYVANNQVFFRDYHTNAYSHPVSDSSQDWIIDYGYEEDGWTVLGFHRRLDTCDLVGDRVITSDTMRLIYSYDALDPADPDLLMYHDKRGFKSVSLLAGSPPPEFLPAESRTLDFLNFNYKLPDNEHTTFHCRVFDLTNITQKYHIVKVSPVFSKGTADNVGHMVLYRCHVADPAALLRNGSSFNCFTDAPDHVQFCREHVASFGHGVSDFYLPEDVGIPFGGVGEANVYVLATHYENEEFTPNLVDNSGIRITITSKLRQHDAGFLTMGNIISPNWAQFIPPGDPDFVQKAYCSMRCLAWGLGDCNSPQTSVPMTMIGVQFHSHSLSKAMKLRHLTYVAQNRARENPWLAYDKTFDSKQQSFRLIKHRHNISCWDELLLECSYDSSKETRPTVGGWTHYDELCRAYVLYYPRKQIEGCMSWSNYDQLLNGQGQRVTGNDLFRTLVRTNWTTDTVMRQNLKRALDQSMENAQCWSSSTNRTVSYAIDYFRQPVVTNKYSEPMISSC